MLLHPAIVKCPLSIRALDGDRQCNFAMLRESTASWFNAVSAAVSGLTLEADRERGNVSGSLPKLDITSHSRHILIIVPTTRRYR